MISRSTCIILISMLLSACDSNIPPKINATTTESITLSSSEATQIPIPNSNPVLYRGDLGRTGNFDAEYIQPSATVQWEYKFAPSVHGAPMLAGSTLFVPSVAGRFAALDITNGEKLWEFTASGKLFSSPAIVDDAVYVGNENGYLYVLDTTNGNELWSLKLDSGLWSAPLIAEDMIFMGSQNGTLYAIDLSTQDIRWQFKAQGWVVSPPAWENGMLFFSERNHVRSPVDPAQYR